MEFSDSKLYACGAEGGEVAGRVRYDAAARLITWFNPGGRQRAYEVETISTNDADRFDFIDTEGRRFVLFELTPGYYNEQIRRPQDPFLVTAAELLATFERTQA